MPARKSKYDKNEVIKIDHLWSRVCVEKGCTTGASFGCPIEGIKAFCAKHIIGHPECVNLTKYRKMNKRKILQYIETPEDLQPKVCKYATSTRRSSSPSTVGPSIVGPSIVGPSTVGPSIPIVASVIAPSVVNPSSGSTVGPSSSSVVDSPHNYSKKSKHDPHPEIRRISNNKRRCINLECRKQAVCIDPEEKIRIYCRNHSAPGCVLADLGMYKYINETLEKRLKINPELSLSKNVELFLKNFGKPMAGPEEGQTTEDNPEDQEMEVKKAVEQPAPTIKPIITSVFNPPSGPAVGLPVVGPPSDLSVNPPIVPSGPSVPSAPAVLFGSTAPAVLLGPSVPAALFGPSGPSCSQNVESAKETTNPSSVVGPSSGPVIGPSSSPIVGPPNSIPVPSPSPVQSPGSGFRQSLYYPQAIQTPLNRTFSFGPIPPLPGPMPPPIHLFTIKCNSKSCNCQAIIPIIPGGSPTLCYDHYMEYKQTIQK